MDVDDDIAEKEPEQATTPKEEVITKIEPEPMDSESELKIDESKLCTESEASAEVK